MEAPAAWGEEMERVLARLSAFLPRSPLPLDHMTSDDDGADVVAFLGRAMDDAIMTNFAGLYYPMKGSVIVGVGRTLRKGSSLKVELGSRNFH
jgi:hypothetical protein